MSRGVETNPKTLLSSKSMMARSLLLKSELVKEFVRESTTYHLFLPLAALFRSEVGWVGVPLKLQKLETYVSE